MLDLEQLERFEKEATPGPWAEFGESGSWWVENTNERGEPAGRPVMPSDGSTISQEDVDLIILMRNKLPELIARARRADELEARAYIPIDLITFA